MMAVDAVRRKTPFFPLFLPATRLDRLGRAMQSGADAVIIDLEDAVAEGDKKAARDALARILPGIHTPVPLLVRINAFGSVHFNMDLEVVARIGVPGIVIPKAEIGSGLDQIQDHLRHGCVVVALVETARGIADARALARRTDRLAFGAIDYAIAIGAASKPEALLAARSELVLASALASGTGPVDGVTPQVNDAEAVARDGRYAASLGFGGKLLVHPAQIAPAIRSFAPDQAEVDRARQLVAQAGDGAGSFEGEMVDLPVLEAARRKVEAYRLAEERLAKIQEY